MAHGTVANEICECGGRLVGKEAITPLTDDNVMSWHRLWADIAQDVDKGAKFCEKCQRIYWLLRCTRCKAEVQISSDRVLLSSRWGCDTEGEVEFGDGTKGPKGQWWHKCYEESLAPGWAPARVQ